MAKYTLKEKILKFLIGNKEPHSIRQISTLLKTDYKNTFNAIKSLNPKTYSETKQGNSNLIKFNPKKTIETLAIEEKRTQEFLSKNPKLKLIKQDIEETNYPFMIALIFGSLTKNKNTPSSDIDLCIICDNEEKSKQLIQNLTLLSTKIEIQNFTTKEFTSMIEKKQDNLGNEIIKNNIILFGTENYYNLISNG